MIIKKIRRKKGQTNATVRLSYNDVRDLANVFFEAEEKGLLNTETRRKLRYELSVLFKLVKYGEIPMFDIQLLDKLVANVAELEEKKESDNSGNQDTQSS